MSVGVVRWGDFVMSQAQGREPLATASTAAPPHRHSTHNPLVGECGRIILIASVPRATRYLPLSA